MSPNIFADEVHEFASQKISKSLVMELTSDRETSDKRNPLGDTNKQTSQNMTERKQKHKNRSMNPEVGVARDQKSRKSNAKHKIAESTPLKPTTSGASLLSNDSYDLFGYSNIPVVVVPDITAFDLCGTLSHPNNVPDSFGRYSARLQRLQK